MFERKLFKTKVNHSNSTGKDYYKYYVSTENDFNIRLIEVSCTGKEQFERFLEYIKKPNIDIASTYDVFQGQNNTSYCRCIL